MNVRMVPFGWARTETESTCSSDYRTIRNFPRDFGKETPWCFASVYRIMEDSDGR
ncbi:MAG: hypothetical protein M9926_09990 [Lentimicrobium sp.]|uniref:hypothetical protein n=1 Tax=Lentimicrobium sp. TaxID=2034841 RepID=UPI0025E2BC01|nr:hypothetical protein [Lentimicrobium sp.]MCO5257077.1 hypothetical protein [Lentimicrobium sp.]